MGQALHESLPAARQLYDRAAEILGYDLAEICFSGPAEKLNATHDDILFSPTKTPEIRVLQARMIRGDSVEVVIQDFEPSSYLREALGQQ